MTGNNALRIHTWPTCECIVSMRRQAASLDLLLPAILARMEKLTSFAGTCDSCLPHSKSQTYATYYLPGR